MVNNRIAHFRKAQGLTQRALAAKVGTSQQQIQRIEAGVQSARLDLAAKIADALAMRLADVFPKVARSKKAKKAGGDSRDILNEGEFAVAGIDPDPRHWTIRFFMFDGREFDFEVSGQERHRLESIVSGSDVDFLVFDSRDKRIAINGNRIAACNIMFDVGVIERTDEEDETFNMTVHLVSSKEPVKFGIDPDELTPEQDENGFSSQLQNLFFYLDGGGEDLVVWFDDEDGERVYIRANHLLLLEVPLICCEPSLLASSDRGDDEQNEQDQEPRHFATDHES
jgi:transcriptional regulator with XRE-family HTH domain